MASMGIKPQTLFEKVAQKNKEIITAEQFKETIKQNLEIYLGEAQLQSLIKHLDVSNQGLINYQVYIKKVQQLTKSFKNKEAWTISKCQFFLAISYEYENQRTKAFYRLKQTFIDFFENTQGMVDLEKISALCKSIVPEVTEKTCQSIYHQAQEIAKSQIEGKINGDSFAAAAINNSFGTFELKSFGKQYYTDPLKVIKLNDQLEEQKRLRKSI